MTDRKDYREVFTFREKEFPFIYFLHFEFCPNKFLESFFCRLPLEAFFIPIFQSKRNSRLINNLLRNLNLKMQPKALMFLVIRILIILALMVGSGFQVMDQVHKFFTKKTTIASRFGSSSFAFNCWSKVRLLVRANLFFNLTYISFKLERKY